jgi:hypothetical protein
VSRPAKGPGRPEAPARAAWVPWTRPAGVLRLMAGRHYVLVTGSPDAIELVSTGHGVSHRWTGPDALDRAAAELAWLRQRWS